MSREHKTWTDFEEAALIEAYRRGMTVAEIAEKLERTEWGVYTKLRRITPKPKGKRNMGERWHAADIITIRKYREQGMEWEEIAKRMQRTVKGVTSFYQTYVHNPKPKWTEAEVMFLLVTMESERHGTQAQRYAWVAEVLGREAAAVRQKHHRLLKEQKLGQERMDSGGGEPAPHSQDSTPDTSRQAMGGDAGVLHQRTGEGSVTG